MVKSGVWLEMEIGWIRLSCSMNVRARMYIQGGRNKSEGSSNTSLVDANPHYFGVQLYLSVGTVTNVKLHLTATNSLIPEK